MGVITANEDTAPSVSIPPYPTRSASSSLESCLDVVPEPTTEWKPDRAPHAMTRGTVGQKYAIRALPVGVPGIAPITVPGLFSF
ncbi:MAG: hypothetical protein QXT69_00925 [Fervidicoccaceae archaeon]